MGNGKLTVYFQKRGGGGPWNREMGNCSQKGLLGTEWEMGNGKWGVDMLEQASGK